MGLDCWGPLYRTGTWRALGRSKPIVKRAFVLVASFIASICVADDLATARLMMDRAHAELGTHRSLTVVLSSRVTDGQAVRNERIELAVMFSTRPVETSFKQLAQLELLEYRDGVLLSRIAGDGVRYWEYDVAKNQYSGTEYGSARHVGNERNRLFQNLVRRSTGARAFLARLLADGFGTTSVLPSAGNRAWFPWRPNAVVSMNGNNIVCDATTPTPNRLTYILEPAPGFGYSLKGAQYIEQTSISGRTRTTEWTVTIYPDTIPKDTSFEFVPPQGSRSVSVEEARDGG